MRTTQCSKCGVSDVWRWIILPWTSETRPLRVFFSKSSFPVEGTYSWLHFLSTQWYFLFAFSCSFPINTKLELCHNEPLSSSNNMEKGYDKPEIVTSGAEECSKKSSAARGFDSVSCIWALLDSQALAILPRLVVGGRCYVKKLMRTVWSMDK